MKEVLFVVKVMGKNVSPLGFGTADRLLLAPPKDSDMYLEASPLKPTSP